MASPVQLQQGEYYGAICRQREGFETSLVGNIKTGAKVVKVFYVNYVLKCKAGVEVANKCVSVVGGGGALS